MSIEVHRRGTAATADCTHVTANVTGRLADHNAGRCRLTADGRAWNIDLVVEFTDETRALKFERYLKSGSGVAFAKRHFVTTHHAQQRFDPMLPDSQRAPK